METIIPQNEPPLKRCRKCGQELPATATFFFRDASKRDGLSTHCKPCKSAVSQAYHATHQESIRAKQKEHAQRPDVQQRLRAQKKLYHSRPDVREHRRAWSKEYLSRPDVQAQRHEYMQAYHSRPGMKDQWRRYNATYLSKPGKREQMKDYQRRFYSNPANREKLQAYKQDYWQRPGKREHHHTLTRANYAATKDTPRYRAKVRTSNRNLRARRKSVMGSHTTAQIRDLLRRQDYRCYYAACGFSKFPLVDGRYAYHIEHTYPLSRAAGTDIPANDIAYIVLACPACNNAKRNKLPHEWSAGGRLL